MAFTILLPCMDGHFIVLALDFSINSMLSFLTSFHF